MVTEVHAGEKRHPRQHDGPSRAQTGQRAGRTMRPLGDVQVYILLTKGSGEEGWGRESTQYLAEKGFDVTKTGVERMTDDIPDRLDF